ncbi:MAG: NRAMP family divalent metal transporter [Gemmatimonadaceae bacterium]
MKKIFQLALGIVTSIGGFLEIGSVTTAAQGGASFGYQLLWAIALGTLCVIFLVEMAGRLSAVSKHTIVAAMRDRFGFRFYFIVLVLMAGVSYLVLAAELGGVALALQMSTGLGFPWWVIPVVLVTWLLLWKATFSVIENGSSLLGLMTVAFAVAAWKLHPHWSQVATGLIPTRPDAHAANYWFIAVSILGASISPYLMYFYSAGAVEEEWDETYIGINRVIAGGGMFFGGFLSAAVLIVAANILGPRGVDVDSFQQVALMMTIPLPNWGFELFVAGMAVACLGAALEITLAISYLFAQGLGWNWSENASPAREARFCALYTVLLALAAIPLLLGTDPVKITVLSMALTAAVLPATIIPFLVLMNDRAYVGDHPNGIISNTVVVVIMVMSFVLAIVAIPLQYFGS